MENVKSKITYLHQRLRASHVLVRPSVQRRSVYLYQYYYLINSRHNGLDNTSMLTVGAARSRIILSDVIHIIFFHVHSASYRGNIGST